MVAKLILMSSLLIVGLVSCAGANPMDSAAGMAEQAGQAVSQGGEQVASGAQVQEQVRNMQQGANNSTAATTLAEDLLDTAFILGKNAARLAKSAHATLVKGTQLQSIEPTMRSLNERVVGAYNQMKNHTQVSNVLKTLEPLVSRGSGALSSLTSYGRNKFSALSQQHEERMKNRQQAQQ